MQSSDEEQGQSLNSIVNRYQRPQRSDPSRSLDNSSLITRKSFSKYKRLWLF